jgi:hypothetical protein
MSSATPMWQGLVLYYFGTPFWRATAPGHQVKLLCYCRRLVLRLPEPWSTSLLREGWGAESPTDSGMSRSLFAVGPAISDCILDKSCSGWIWILDFSIWKGAPVMQWCIGEVQIWCALSINACHKNYSWHFPGYGYVFRGPKNFDVLWVDASTQLA